MIDGILFYELDKLLAALIPDFVVSKLPTIVASLFVTTLPVTPIDMVLFSSIFVFLYFTNIFGLGSKNKWTCRYNQPKPVSQSSILSTLYKAYMIYLPIAFIINYNTIFKMQVRLNYIGHTI
jgi:hypothetical protein